MRIFTHGDIDGFFGLAIDNLVQMLMIISLCNFAVGIPMEFIISTILPAAAVSLLVGNLYYGRQAMQLAKKTGRTDITALPYGINTVSLFAYVFLVMIPVKIAAVSDGKTAREAAMLAWKAGMVACLGSGIIELAGALIAEKIRKITPRAALLSTLAGIALGFISFTFFFRAYAHPVVGLATFGIILLIYFGKVRFKWGLPGGLVAVTLGTALAWVLSVMPQAGEPIVAWADFQGQFGKIGFYCPVPRLAELLDGMKYMLPYVGIIIPMGVFNVVGSLQNIESAEAAGDSYPTAPSLAINGTGTIAAAIFGSCFPTTIYIGHPGWKDMGAGAGYSILNAIFFTVVCLTGTMSLISELVPIEAGMAIVIWIGIVITVQAFKATPARHTPAVVIGLLPAIAAWGAMMSKAGIRAVTGAGYSWSGHAEEIMSGLAAADIAPAGLFSLEQGFIFTSMILAGMTVAIIERKFIAASLWCLAAAALSFAGLMHSYRFTPGDVVLDFGSPGWKWTAAYVVTGLVFLSAKWLDSSLSREGMTE